MNVLLIEDDEDTALALEMLLGQAGMCVRWARDGREALRMLDSRSASPADVIVLDLRLPDLTVSQLLGEMRTLGSVPGIVVYSAAPDAVLHEAAERIGAAAAIRKPSDRATLVRAIEAAVRPSQGFLHA